jgi:hypothetical protein
MRNTSSEGDLSSGSMSEKVHAKTQELSEML